MVKVAATDNKKAADTQGQYEFKPIAPTTID